MKKVRIWSIALLMVAASAVAVRAAAGPDSKKQPLADGCNRTQLGLLGEAAATMAAGPHPTAFPSWVYVNGDSHPKTLEGTTLGTHTAGTDLFGVHDTYDMNIDVKPDPGFEGLLSSRNAEESPPQIHTEWESGLAPLFAWPSPGDHVRETGSEIWDCGHWQDGNRQVPEGDFLPGDPLGTAGAEPIGGEEIEIHPISELATWRANGDFVPHGRPAPVHASRLDVAISNQGGKAKGVEECAMVAPAHPTDAALRPLVGPGCSTLQDVTGRDYTYDLAPPGPRPSSTSRLQFQQDILYSHNGPKPKKVKAQVIGDHVHITVPFSQVDKSKDLQDFGGTWHAWWSDDATPVHHLRVTLSSVTIRNNLDVDSGDTNGNPTITPEGEWNMFVDVNGDWTNLHDPRPGHTDLMPILGAVPSAIPNPQVLSTAAVAPTDVYLPDTASLHLFTDARECDQPGYVDCPTQNELATTGGSAGRTDISLPVSQLAGHTTLLSIHPPVCPLNTPCPEEHNKITVCPNGCYEIAYRIEDVTGAPARASVVTAAGDGTASGTVFGGRHADSLGWWLAPPSRYAQSQEEENAVIADVIGRIRG